jgi:hypothetical protein
MVQNLDSLRWTLREKSPITDTVFCKELILNQCQKQNVLWQLPSSIGISLGSKYILANRTDKTFIFGITKVVFSARPITDTVYCKELIYAFEDEVFSWPPTTHTLCTYQNKSLLAV